MIFQLTAEGFTDEEMVSRRPNRKSHLNHFNITSNKSPGQPGSLSFREQVEVILELLWNDEIFGLKGIFFPVSEVFAWFSRVYQSARRLWQRLNKRGQLPKTDGSA